MKKINSNQLGFSLLELLTTIAVISILAELGWVNYKLVLEDIHEIECDQAWSNMQLAYAGQSDSLGLDPGGTSNPAATVLIRHLWTEQNDGTQYWTNSNNSIQVNDLLPGYTPSKCQTAQAVATNCEGAGGGCYERNIELHCLKTGIIHRLQTGFNTGTPDRYFKMYLPSYHGLGECPISGEKTGSFRLLEFELF